jgi:hypothetical protein
MKKEYRWNRLWFLSIMCSVMHISSSSSNKRSSWGESVGAWGVWGLLATAQELVWMRGLSKQDVIWMGWRMMRGGRGGGGMEWRWIRGGRRKICEGGCQTVRGA